MPKMQRRKRLIVIIIVLAIGFVVALGLLIKQFQRPTPVSTPAISKQSTPSTDTKPIKPDTSPVTTAPTVDPLTLNSIDIQPMAITVYYSKGTPGFEFTVLKTGDKTQYVQFTSPKLVGTKCTNDQGVFASIIKNPSVNETQTIVQMVKVGDDTYGLSLASASCTDNSDLLTQYQTGFKNGFSNLKAL